MRLNVGAGACCLHNANQKQTVRPRLGLELETGDEKPGGFFFIQYFDDSADPVF